MTICFRCLFLFLPVHDISHGEDCGVGRQLESFFHFDELSVGEYLWPKGFTDEIGVGFRSRGDNLPNSIKFIQGATQSNLQRDLH